MKKHWSTILLVAVFFLGLCLLLYPSFSNYWNSFHQSRVISSYENALADVTPKEFGKERGAAQAYNEKLRKKADRYILSDRDLEEYNSLLNLSGSGVMGYIEIPSIQVKLPIYHGVSDPVLQVAVGHIEGTSLPVGGKGTHTVLSGHRGLPSAKLFTDIDKLVPGDVFFLHILDEVLAYEVDRISIVEPDDVAGLDIDKNEDYCTLLTCTPYAINTHRLLVRGRRTEYNELIAGPTSADATQIDPIYVIPFIAVPILLILCVYMLIKYRKKRS